MLKQKSFKILLLLIFLQNCSINESLIKHGVSNLDIKETGIKTNLSNKNDISKILGEPLVKEYPNENTWLYMETVKKRNIFGSKQNIKSLFLLLEFDEKGLLLSKHLLNEKDMNELNFDKSFTDSKAVQSSFSKKFFSSMRKRFINKQNDLNN